MEESIIKSFNAYVCKKRGFKPSTAETYLTQVRIFLKHVGKEFDPEKVENEDIIEYLHALRVKYNRKENHRQAVKAALSIFFKFIALEYGIPNPAAELPVIKKEFSDPVYPSETEVEQILLQADTHKKENFRKRNTAALAILPLTGIRMQEFEKIRVGDISIIHKGGNATHFELVVSAGKGSYSRTIPFGLLSKPDICTELFVRYYMWVKLELKQPLNKPLFFHFKYNNKPENRDLCFGRKGIEYLLRRTRKKAGIDKRIVPHSFRHFYATYGIINGIDIITLSKYMGHANIQTTMAYIHLAQREGGDSLNHSAVVNIKTPAYLRGYASLMRDI